MKTPSSTPGTSRSASASGDSPLRNVGWFSFGVPALACLLGTFAALVVVDVYYAPASGIHSSLQKYFPKNGWAISNGAKHTFHTPEGGATSKPIVAPERLSRVDDTPSDSQYAVPDVVEDFVPIKLATSDDTRATAADTALRSATTLQDSDSRARPLKDSDEDSSLSVMQEAKQYTEDDMNALLTGEGKLFGKVSKKGMLPTEKWLPPKDHNKTLKPLNKWLWNTLLGTDDGRMLTLPPGESPPKAGICTLLFNPMYKFIVVKNTKVAGTSLFLKFGGFCPSGINLETAKVTPNCLWRVSDITRNGLRKLGYDSFEAMWADYTVLALVRNPYDRAGSSYDYTLGRRTSRSGDCRDPTFEHYTAKPYVIGLQDTLFGCGDRVHDFYHVEPQHTCLLDAQANLVVDWIVRVNSLEKDLKPVLYALNRRRLPGAPRLKGGIGWEQRGPIADENMRGGQGTVDLSKSRHASKFAECGAQCVRNVYAYYRKDFELLQYPVEASS